MMNILKQYGMVFLLGLVTIFSISCSKKKQADYLTIKGSDTMVHLVSSLAEEYMKLHPGADISVTGGGSGTGIAALINGTTDICAASREMKQKEIVQAKDRSITPERVAVARDGIAVVVHPDNPVEVLSMEQLKKIFTGAYISWSSVRGPDESIIVMSRESSSGTYVFFQEHVLRKQDYTASARLMAATAAIIQAVSQDRWSIGYVGLGYALEAGDKVKIVKVKSDSGSPAVIPSEETVRSGDYAIARPLFLYMNSGTNALIDKFVEYALSPEGQEIVRESGYVPVN